jgi:hypothetical protein
MVASKPRFPLVRCAMLVCSLDDLRNSGVCSPWPARRPIGGQAGAEDELGLRYPSLRVKRSNPFRRAKEEWIASSRSLSLGARWRDPLAPRNDDVGCLKIESEICATVRPDSGGVLICPAPSRLRRTSSTRRSRPPSPRLWRASWAASHDETVMARQPKLRSSVGWCPWPESNQHSLRNSILSRARLPVPPQGPPQACLRGRHREAGGI